MERAARGGECTCLYFHPSRSSVMIDKQGLQSDPTSPLQLLHLHTLRDVGAGKCEVKSVCVRVCLDVFVRVAVRTRLRREDDSKCHSVV